MNLLSLLGEATLPPSLDRGVESAAQLAFLPHAVRFNEDPASESLQLEGRVAGCEFLGEFMRCEIRVNQANVTTDQAHVRGTARIAEGTSLRLSVPAREPRLLGRASGTA